MTRRWFVPGVGWTAALLLLAGCEGLTVPEREQEASTEDLTIIRVAPDAPPLTATEVSFWIVRGEERSVEITYAAANGYYAKCLRLVVPADAPLRHADGRVFAPGDSVRVTVRVVDPALFMFEFDPAGIRFNPSSPAYMEVRYRWMHADLNGDGVVDSEDERIAASFGIWQMTGQEGRWSSVPSMRDEGILEIRGQVRAFTRYALASD